jgi:putative aldouronate transport system substrate-binding protein
MKKLSRREMLKLMGLTTAGAFLAACGGTPEATEMPADGGGDTGDEVEPTEEPGMGDPVVVTFVESWFGVPQFSASIEPITREISTRLQSDGINVEFQSMVLDDHSAKYPVLYASGADFVAAFDAPWNKMSSLIQQGALHPVEGLMDAYGPNVESTTGEEIVEFNFQEGPEGDLHLYGIPARFYYSGTSGVIIREDLREKYGAPAPTSEGGYASLEPFLAAIAENEPSLIPFVNRPQYAMTAGNCWAGAQHMKGLGTGLAIPNQFEGTELTEMENLDWYQEAAALARKWYELGYLPQEAVSADYDVLNDYFNTQKGAAIQDNEPEYKAFEKGKAIRELGGDAAGYDVSGNRAMQPKGKGNLKQWNFVVLNTNASEDKRIAAMEVWNWFTASQENADLWLMGIEGENYIAEDNLRFSDPEGVDHTRNYRRQWYVSGITGDFQRQPADLTSEAEEALAFFTTKDNWVFSPYDKFDVNTKEIETELNALSAAIEEAEFGIKTGSVPTEDAFATYTMMLDDAGRQRVKEWYQEKYDAWVAENKAYIDNFETGL